MSTELLFATHTDLLVLGVGESEALAIEDASVFADDVDLLQTARITPDAAAYVESGGDCRGLTLGEDDVFRLRPR